MSETAADRLRIALELFEVGEQLVRSRLRREHPDWDDDRIDSEFRQWLRHRPGAPFGDFPGGPSARVIHG
ncbi:MAG: hypothetical protein ACK5MT_06015 [Actinomycetales bacterium]